MLLNRFKSLSINLSLSLIALIVAIAAAELVLRFTHFSSLLHRQYAYPAYYFVPDKQLGYDIGLNIRGKQHTMDEESYDLFSNRYRCFDYEREVPDDYGVIVGDSFTWGYTPLDKKWTTRLEELSGIFMLKCGVSGFGTKQELIKARKVIEAVGKKPKFLIVLHTNNDLHDDFVFPHRTVIGGHLVGTAKTANLLNGEIRYFNRDELTEKYKKYIDGSLRNRLRKLRYNMITYRLYRYEFIPFIEVQKAKLKAWFESREGRTGDQPAAVQSGETQPALATDNKRKSITREAPSLLWIDTRGGAYDIPLQQYLDDYETPWYQEAIADHVNTIKEIKDYADSKGSKLLFIDAGGSLSHPRFADVRQYLDDSYYSLASDYPASQWKRWKYDGHWNEEDNQTVGEYIYNHFKKILHAER